MLPTRHRRFRSAIRLAIALLALVGQSALVSISASPDEIGAAPHVERSGVSLHHAHNEATCVVCRVMSLHGRTASLQPAPLVTAAGPGAKPGVLARRPEATALPSNFSRAPPGIA